MLSKLPASLSFDKNPRRTFFIFSALLVLLLYWKAFGAPFVYDDLDQIVHNPNLGAWSSFVHRFLLQPVSLGNSFLGSGGSTYRPVFWMSLFVDHALWGLNAGGYHATNIALHLLNGNLVFALFRRLKVPVSVAAAIGLLWLTLPIHTEVVAWVSGRAYLLCTFFVLLCLLSAVTYAQRRGFAGAWLCFGAAACALLSHELGAVILPLLLVLVFVNRLAWSRGLLTALGAIALAVFGAVALRVGVGVKSASTLASIKWVALAFWEYVRLALLPVHMSLERSTSISLVRPQPWFYLGCVSFVLALIYAWMRRERHSIPLAGLLWFAIGIAPFCLLTNYQGIAERFVYLAAIGITAAMVTASSEVNHLQVRRALLVCVAVWSVWNLYRTSVRVADWSDEVRLYRSSLAATPRSPLVHFNLAFSLQERGEFQEAIAEYGRVIDIDQNYPNGYAGMGDVYLRMNSYAAAEAAYRKALVQNPKDTAVLLNIGAAYQGAGASTEAEATYKQVLQLNPSSSPAHVNLGVLYLGENRQNDAMHQFAMAIDLKTTDPVPYYNLGAIFQKGGRGDLAMVLYRKVLELKPGDADTLRNMQLIQGSR